MKHLNFKKLFETQQEAKEAAEEYAKDNDYSIEIGTEDLIATFDINYKALQGLSNECGAYIVKNGTPNDDIFAWWKEETYKEVKAFQMNKIRDAKTLSELANALNELFELDELACPWCAVDEVCEKRGWEDIYGDNGNYYDLVRSDKEYLTMNEVDGHVECYNREDI